MSLFGCSLIGSKYGTDDGAVFFGSNPATGDVLQPGYHTASSQEVQQAAQLATRAFSVYVNLSGDEKGKFLRSIAAGIEERSTEIVDRAKLETSLPEASAPIGRMSIVSLAPPVKTSCMPINSPSFTVALSGSMRRVGSPATTAGVGVWPMALEPKHSMSAAASAVRH